MGYIKIGQNIFKKERMYYLQLKKKENLLNNQVQ